MTIRLDNLSQLLFFAATSKDCEYNYNVYMSPFLLTWAVKKEIVYIKAVFICRIKLCISFSDV